ncbi:MAG TPA: formate dehydrogenase subunit delta [Burkholderiaceae bacterium]|nr:formate dehydrogenase subunit delta [Burkholderiaceae bacterium]
MENLVKMANQIGGFYESYPDQVEASNEIANHLKKFWEPRMRSQLLDHVDNQHGAGLSDILLLSISSHRQALQPK